MSAQSHQSPAQSASTPSTDTTSGAATDYGSNQEAMAQMQSATGTSADGDLEHVADVTDPVLANHVAQAHAGLDSSIGSATGALATIPSALKGRVLDRIAKTEDLGMQFDVIVEDVLLGRSEEGSCVPIEDINWVEDCVQQVLEACDVLGWEAELASGIAFLGLEGADLVLEPFIADMAEVKDKFEANFAKIQDLQAQLATVYAALEAHQDELTEELQGFIVDKSIDAAIGSLAALTGPNAPFAAAAMKAGTELVKAACFDDDAFELRSEALASVDTIGTGLLEQLVAAGEIDGKLAEGITKGAAIKSTASDVLGYAKLAVASGKVAIDLAVIEALDAKASVLAADQETIRQDYAVATIGLEPVRALVYAVREGMPSVRTLVENLEIQIADVESRYELYTLI